jgi:hypothetical protein
VITRCETNGSSSIYFSFYTKSIISDRILTAQRSHDAFYILIPKLPSFFLCIFLIRLFLCRVQIFDSKRKAYKYLFASTYNGGGENRLVGSRHSGSDAADVRFVSGCQSLHLFSTLFRHFVFFLFFFFCFFTFLGFGLGCWAAPCVWFSDRTR